VRQNGSLTPINRWLRGFERKFEQPHATALFGNFSRFFPSLKVYLSLGIKTIKTTAGIKTINVIDAFKLTVLICYPSHYIGI
jgi:hypothetical protein